MGKHEPTQTPAGKSEVPAHTELLLSGDFASPAEVLAAREITDARKREILESWVRDLMGKSRNPHAKKLLPSVRQALASLDAPPFD